MSQSFEDIRVNLGKFIYFINKLFRPILKTEDYKGLSLTKNQIRAISLLGNEGSSTATQIGQSLSLEKGSVTSLIAGLEDLNITCKSLDEDDKRKSWIYLTDQGLEIFEEQKEEYLNQIKEVFKNLSDKELRDFNNNLISIMKVIENIEN